MVLLEVAACLHALQQYMRSWGTMSISDKGFRTLAQSLRSRLVEKGAGGELAQPDLSSVVWALEDTLKLVVYTLVDAAAADLGFDQKQLPTERLDAVSGYDQRPSRADQLLLPPASLPPSLRPVRTGGAVQALGLPPEEGRPGRWR